MLAVVMLAGIIPTMGITVSAEVDHSHDNNTFAPWTSTTSLQSSSSYPDGILNLSGGTITGNTAGGTGAGIDVCDSGAYINLSGDPVLGADDTIYLRNNTPINITDDLTGATPYKVGMSAINVITNGLDGKGTLADFVNGNGTAYDQYACRKV